MAKPPSQKMRVLKGTPQEISRKRPVTQPTPPETLMWKGNANVLDLVCGSCGAVLATGVPADNISAAVVCNGCGAVNDAVAKQ